MKIKKNYFKLSIASAEMFKSRPFSNQPELAFTSFYCLAVAQPFKSTDPYFTSKLSVFQLLSKLYGNMANKQTLSWGSENPDSEHFRQERIIPFTQVTKVSKGTHSVHHLTLASLEIPFLLGCPLWNSVLFWSVMLTRLLSFLIMDEHPQTLELTEQPPGSTFLVLGTTLLLLSCSFPRSPEYSLGPQELNCLSLIWWS